MFDSRRTARRVIVIGGGISGLAAAHRLRELKTSLDVTLLEAGDRLGGALQTVERDGFLIERGADNFITSLPWARQLCERIGLKDELLPTSPDRRQAFVVRRGRLRPIPDGFLLMAPSRWWPIATTRVLSLRGKLRLACERYVPPRHEADEESLADFATRRLGREVYERLVQPLVGGIYTGDPTRLSVQATMRQFVEMERRHGSLTRAALRGAKQNQSQSGARYSLFTSLKGGMSRLVEALATRLPAGTIRLKTPVTRLRRTTTDWTVTLAGGDRVSAAGVIVATPALCAARLLSDVDQALGRQLAAIPHAACAIVTLAFRREQIGHSLNGCGFVVPRVEGREILSCSFSSVKYAGRAPNDCVLLRVFLGGAGREGMAVWPDLWLQTIAVEELRALLKIRGEPTLVDVTRPPMLPQYYVGHQAHVAEIEAQIGNWPGLQLAGNAYHGVGIPQCIHSGESAAERLLQEFAEVEDPRPRTSRPLAVQTVAHV